VHVRSFIIFIVGWSSHLSFSLLDGVVVSFKSLHFCCMEEQHHQEEGKGMMNRGMVVEGRDTEDEHLLKR
jgi:hypothetical protein